MGDVAHRRDQVRGLVEPAAAVGGDRPDQRHADLAFHRAVRARALGGARNVLQQPRHRRVATGRRERERRVQVVERVVSAFAVELRFPFVRDLGEAGAHVRAVEHEPPQERRRVDERRFWRHKDDSQFGHSNHC